MHFRKPQLLEELAIRPEFDFQSWRVIANKNGLNTNYRPGFGMIDNTITDNTYSDALQIIYQLDLRSIRMFY